MILPYNGCQALLVTDMPVKLEEIIKIILEYIRGKTKKFNSIKNSKRLLTPTNSVSGHTKVKIICVSCGRGLPQVLIRLNYFENFTGTWPSSELTLTNIIMYELLTGTNTHKHALWWICVYFLKFATEGIQRGRLSDTVTNYK